MNKEILENNTADAEVPTCEIDPQSPGTVMLADEILPATPEPVLLAKEVLPATSRPSGVKRKATSNFRKGHFKRAISLDERFLLLEERKFRLDKKMFLLDKKKYLLEKKKVEQMECDFERLQASMATQGQEGQLVNLAAMGRTLAELLK